MNQEEEGVLVVGPAGSRLELDAYGNLATCPACGGPLSMTSASGYRGPPRDEPVVWQLGVHCLDCGSLFRIYARPGPEWVGGTALEAEGPDGVDPDRQAARMLPSERASQVLGEPQLREYLRRALASWASNDPEPPADTDEWREWADLSLDLAAWVLQAAHGLRALAREGRGTWTAEDESAWPDHVERFVRLGGRLPPDFLVRIEAGGRSPAR